MTSLADLLVTQQSKGSSKLEKISTIINWDRLGSKLELIIRRGKMGRPPYPSLVLFKVLVLQRLYDLSDPQMEEMLYDRLSFRRFCGFGLTDKLPDETTICKFRGALGNKVNTLLEAVLQDLADQGLSMKGGAIVDATVIASKSSRPKGGEVSKTDPEAGWTKKAGSYHHGYKMHTCVDEEHGLVQGLEVTSADVHDSLVFGQLLYADDSRVYADKAYDSQKNRNLLKEYGIEDRILYKGRQGSKQPQWQKQLNKLWNKQRSGIERTFAHLKGQLGLGRCRYFGLEKTKQWATLNAIAYNLGRAIKILPPQRLAIG
jgi:IS5 family transposase